MMACVWGHVTICFLNVNSGTVEKHARCLSAFGRALEGPAKVDTQDFTKRLISLDALFFLGSQPPEHTSVQRILQKAPVGKKG